MNQLSPKLVAKRMSQVYSHVHTFLYVPQAILSFLPFEFDNQAKMNEYR